MRLHVFINEVVTSETEVSSVAWLLQQFFMVITKKGQDKNVKRYSFNFLLLPQIMKCSCCTTRISPSIFCCIQLTAPLSVVVSSACFVTRFQTVLSRNGYYDAVNVRRESRHLQFFSILFK